MDQDLLSWIMGVHGVVLPISLVGLYRYSNRSSLYVKTDQDTEHVLSRLRRKVAIGLEEELTSIFQRAEGVPRIVTPGCLQ